MGKDQEESNLQTMKNYRVLPHLNDADPVSVPDDPEGVSPVPEQHVSGSNQVLAASEASMNAAEGLTVAKEGKVDASGAEIECKTGATSHAADPTEDDDDFILAVVRERAKCTRNGEGQGSKTAAYFQTRPAHVQTKATVPGAISVAGIGAPRPETLETSSDAVVATTPTTGAKLPSRSGDEETTVRSSFATDAGQSSDFLLLEADMVVEDEEAGDEKLLVQAKPMNGLFIINRDRLKDQCCNWKCGAAIILVSLAATALGLGLGLGRRPDTRPILQRVRERGVLKCGVGAPSPGLHFTDEHGEKSGFDVALCHAIAAAVLGDEARVEFESVGCSTRFRKIVDNELDVLASGAAHTMQRQVHERRVETGLSFSSPYLYEGLHVAGDPHSVACLENGIKHTKECAQLSVCAIAGSSRFDVLSRLLPGRQIYAAKDNEEMIQAFLQKKCLVLAQDGHTLKEEAIRDLGFEGPYVLGTSMFSKEVYCLVSRSDDAQWAAFVDSVLQSLLLAEKHGITAATADQFPQTDAFGIDHSNMFRNAIESGGNYGELYDRFLENVYPEKQINRLNLLPETGSGLLYPHPFGSAQSEGDAGKGYIKRIQEEGKVRCAIIPKRPGFAAKTLYEPLTRTPEHIYGDYGGIDVDLCHALSAALFSGYWNVELIEVETEEEGYQALEKGLVDVFSGASWTFQSSTRVSETGTRLSFSPPYFYNNTSVNGQQENLVLATTTEDHGWSSFVYWIVMGLLHAEENGVTMDKANDMPEVNLFGPGNSRMLRDAILAVGHYGELYNRTLEAHYPRGGRNLLNSGLNPGPQHYPIPGLID